MALDRRIFLGLASACLVTSVTAGLPQSGEYPEEVAGIRLPRTRLCAAAFELSRSLAPPFLINHCLRTYVFGALHAARHRQSFDMESAFVAAVLHDLGLLKTVASRNGPFEVDGADRAERLVRDSGGSDQEARSVWRAIVMHDMRFSIPTHESPEAALVAFGAGADVVGPDEGMIGAADVQNVVAALPRLDFKRQFIATLTDHCRRKPGAQNGTWLEGFCRAHSNVPPSATERAILDAPFPE